MPTAWQSVEVKPQHTMMDCFQKEKKNELIWVEEVSLFMTVAILLKDIYKYVCHCRGAWVQFPVGELRSLMLPLPKNLGDRLSEPQSVDHSTA